MPIVAAPFIGSFLGVLILRLPDGEPVLIARSACSRCKRTLAVRDLVPFVSWALSLGRCRRCRAAVSWFYPLIELAALVVALWSAALVSGWLLWASCALGWTLLALACIDWRRFLLPDVLCLPLIAGGLVVAWTIDPRLLPDHAIGAAAGFLVFLAIGWLYRRLRGQEGLGTGDAKLLAAAGAWTSWAGLPSIVLLAAIGALAVALVASLRGAPLSATARVPFGSYLAAGLWLVWLYGPLVPIG